MMRMNIGYVYKIYENTNRAVFYGSTKQALSKRIYVHKSQYKLWCNSLYQKTYRLTKNTA